MATHTVCSAIHGETIFSYSLIKFSNSPLRSAFNIPAIGKQPSAYHFRAPFPIYHSMFDFALPCTVCALCDHVPFNVASIMPPCPYDEISCMMCHLVHPILPSCVVISCHATQPLFVLLQSTFFIVCIRPPCFCAVTFLLMICCPYLYFILIHPSIVSLYSGFLPLFHCVAYDDISSQYCIL